jgi:hypothetical protein
MADIDDKIDMIAGMLGQEKVPDDMKDMIKSFMSKLEDGEKSSPAHDNSLEVLGDAKNVIEKLQKMNDPRIHLLLAIKPFLNSRRQKKVAACVNILRIAMLTELFKND